MEKMPYQPHSFKVFPPSAEDSARTDANHATWRNGLPTLAGETLTLRQLRREDALSLFSMLTTEEVSRFISPPPATVEEFERFIDWTHEKRKAGTYACFAVVPHGMDTAIGIFQVRALGSNFQNAEWGFVLGSPFWGKGLFVEGAKLVLQFAFDELGVHRLEARSAVENTRGIGALRKVRAVPEGVLRRAFQKNGRYYDQVLWSILADDWRRSLQDSSDTGPDLSDIGLDVIVEPMPEPPRLH